MQLKFCFLLLVLGLSQILAWWSVQRLLVQGELQWSMFKSFQMWYPVESWGETKAEEPLRFLNGSDGSSGQKDSLDFVPNTTLPQGQKDIFELLPNTSTKLLYPQGATSEPGLFQKADIVDLSNMTSSTPYPQETTTTQQFLNSSEVFQGQTDAAHFPQNTTLSHQNGSDGSSGEKDAPYFLPSTRLPQGHKDIFELLPNTSTKLLYPQGATSEPGLFQKADIADLSNMTSSTPYPQETTTTQQFLNSSEVSQGQTNAALFPQNTTLSHQKGSDGSPGQKDVRDFLPNTTLSWQHGIEESQRQKDIFELLSNTSFASQYPQNATSESGLPQKADIVDLSSMTSSTQYPQETTTTPEPIKKMTLVLAATINDAAFARLAGTLASLATFAKDGSIHELILVVPDEDMSIFSDSLEYNGSMLWEAINRSDAITTPGFVDCWRRKKHFPVRILTDSQVMPTPVAKLFDQIPRSERPSSGGRGGGYRLQMLLKLGIAVHVETQFYVTLDCDVYAKRPFGYEDLVTNDGKARIQGESRYGRTQHRDSWWKASGEALDAKDCVNQDEPTIGVTPAVLSTRVSLAMIERLYCVHGNNTSWDLLLFTLLTTRDWTEYTLHFTAACVMGLRKEVFDSKETQLYDYSGFGWMPNIGIQQRLSWRNDFGHGAIFGVKQSIAGLDSKTINLVLLSPIYCSCESEESVSE